MAALINVAPSSRSVIVASLVLSEQTHSETLLQGSNMGFSTGSANGLELAI